MGSREFAVVSALPLRHSRIVLIAARFSMQENILTVPARFRQGFNEAKGFVSIVGQDHFDSDNLDQVLVFSGIIKGET